MRRTCAEVLGWYGAFAILVAYALVSFGYLEVESWGYQVLNLTGAVGMITISLVKKAYPPAALNVVWMVIAVVALVRIVFV